MTISLTSLIILASILIGISLLMIIIMLTLNSTLLSIKKSSEESLKHAKSDYDSYYHDPLEYSKIEIHDYFADLIHLTGKDIITYFDTKYTYAGSQEEIGLIANHYYDKAVDNIDQLLYLTELGFKTNKNVTIVCIVNRKTGAPERDKHTVFITFNAKEYWEDENRYDDFMNNNLSKTQEEKIDYLKTKYF